MKLYLIAALMLVLSFAAYAQSPSQQSYPCAANPACSVQAQVAAWFDSQVGYTHPASREWPLPVQITAPSGPITSTNGVLFSGQAKIAVTGTAVELTTNPAYSGLVAGIVIKACSGPSPEHINANVIYVAANANVQNTGGGNGNGDSIGPGERLGVNINNPSYIWINGTANDCVSWSGN